MDAIRSLLTGVNEEARKEDTNYEAAARTVHRMVGSRCRGNQKCRQLATFRRQVRYWNLGLLPHHSDAFKLKGKDDVDCFIERLQDFIKSELDNHTALADAVYGERRRATGAARKSGKKLPWTFALHSTTSPFDAARRDSEQRSPLSQLGSNPRNESRVSRISRNLLILNNAKVIPYYYRHCPRQRVSQSPLAGEPALPHVRL